MTYHSPYDTNAGRRLLARELGNRLREFHFHYFVTLASNHRPLSPATMRERLKRWDAKVNRKLLGPKWRKRPDERLLWFAFLEKAEINPHWHLIVQLDPAPPTPGAIARQSMFAVYAHMAWKQEMPSGDADVKPFDSPEVIWYCQKEMWCETSFLAFILSTELWKK